MSFRPGAQAGRRRRPPAVHRPAARPRVGPRPAPGGPGGPAGRAGNDGHDGMPPAKSKDFRGSFAAADASGCGRSAR